MRPWTPEADAALVAHVTCGAQLGALAHKLGRTTLAVSARARALGLLEVDLLAEMETIRPSWLADWLSSPDPYLTHMQAQRCQHLWISVFKLALSDAIDDARRQSSRDPVTHFLCGYIAQAAAREVLDLAGLDPDDVRERLCRLVANQGLDALKRRLTGVDLSGQTPS